MSLLGGEDQVRHGARPGSVAALVLAAGAGRRFGAEVKQLAELAGRPLVRWAVAAAIGAGVDRVVVVVGHHAADVAAAVDGATWPVGGPSVEIVVNPRHEAGQGTSLAAGASHLLAAGTPPDAVVVLLADQPGVRSPVVRSVAAAVLGGADAARASHLDGVSHPVALAGHLLERLTEPDGDRGARRLLAELDVVPVLAAGTVPRDVDTPEDLAALRRAWQAGSPPSGGADGPAQ